MTILPPGVILGILERFGINLVPIWCALGDLGLLFWYHFTAFAPGLGLVWHHPSACFVLTLCGLNLDTNLHEVFVKASWYSVKASWYSTNSFLMLLRDSFFVFPQFFAVHNSFLVFHKSCSVFHTCCLVFLGASRYYIKASRYSSNQYSLRVRSSLRFVSNR